MTEHKPGLMWLVSRILEIEALIHQMFNGFFEWSVRLIKDSILSLLGYLNNIIFYKNYKFTALYGVIFPGKESSAGFSNYRLWESAGFIFAYILQTQVGLKPYKRFNKYFKDYKNQEWIGVWSELLCN